MKFLKGLLLISLTTGSRPSRLNALHLHPPAFARLNQLRMLAMITAIPYMILAAYNWIRGTLRKVSGPLNRDVENINL